MMDASETLKIIGGIAGIVALIWRLLDTFKSYLQIDLEISKEAGSTRLQLKTGVENKNHIGKNIRAAFLLIGPQSEPPEQIVKKLGGRNRNLAREFFTLSEVVSTIAKVIRSDHNIDASGIYDREGRALIPLPHYYEENRDIGDERLTYTIMIDSTNFPIGVYGVRFYVEPRWMRYYRVVQDAFEILPAEPKRT